MRVEVVDGEGYVNPRIADGVMVQSWNLLKFSGDALDLAVQLRLEIFIHEKDTSATAANHQLASEFNGDDAGADTRRAVTRAACEIGR